jgi:hypothetical protein
MDGITDATATGKALVRATSASVARGVIGSPASTAVLTNTVGTMPAAVGGVVTLDLSVAQHWKGSLSANIIINFTNVPASGTLAEVTITVTQAGAGGFNITNWQVAGASRTPYWSTGNAAFVSPVVGDVSVVRMHTVDGGATLEGTGATSTVGRTGSAADLSSGPLPVAMLPTGGAGAVHCIAGVWQARPDSRTDTTWIYVAHSSSDPTPTDFVAGRDIFLKPSA